MPGETQPDSFPEGSTLSKKTVESAKPNRNDSSAGPQLPTKPGSEETNTLTNDLVKPMESNPLVEQDEELEEDEDASSMKVIEEDYLSHIQVPELPEEDWETDLELDDGQQGKEKNTYILACQALGIVPVTQFKKQMDTTQVVLKNHGLGPRGAQAIATSLMTNLTVVLLDLSNNGIDQEGGVAIGDMLKENYTISQLNLANNKLGALGGRAIAKAVAEDNVSIKSLILSGNNLCDLEATAFGEMLQKNSNLAFLDLSYNQIGEVGALALGSGLMLNSTLKELILAWNNIRGKGLIGFMGCLKDNTSLHKLDLQWNGVGDIGGVGVAQLLSKNNGITHYNLSNCRIGDNGMVAIAKAIDQNYVIRELNLSSNLFSDIGAIALFKAIPNSNCIKKLDITNIKYSREARLKYEEMKSEKPEVVIVE